MTDWEPATEAEAALRDALRTGDQELYFRILSRIDLLLPVSPEVLAGRAPMGWGTWTTGGRTHILAFTSTEAMRACLAEHTGSARHMPYHELAAAWPDDEWWLAINPGLPIEGYLPAWFVSQLVRGEVRLPGRTMAARARVEAATAARARGAAPVVPPPPAPLGGRRVLPMPPVPPQLGAHQAGDTEAPRPAPTRPDPGRPRVPAHAAPEPEPEREPRRLTVIPPRALPPRTHAPEPPATPEPPPPAARPEPQPAAWQPSPVPLAAPPLPTVPPPLPAPSPLPVREPTPPPTRALEGYTADTRLRHGEPPSGGGLAARLAEAARVTQRPTEPAWSPTRPSEPEPAWSPNRSGADLETTERLPSAGTSAADRWREIRDTSIQVVEPQVEEPPARRSEPVDAEVVVPAPAPEPEPEPPAEPEPDFEPANEVEAELLGAANDGQTDHFLSTLLLAKVLVPIPDGMSTVIKPGEPMFVWRREQVEGQPYVVVFTSQDRINEYLGEGVQTISVKFVELITKWPDDSWAFAVNPGTPVGATLPGAQIRALATWAREVGLTDQPSVEYEEAAVAVGTAVVPANRPVVMQKPIAPTQVGYYLERGYDRVSGFVQRASEVAHLITPDQLYQALGLGYAGSPFKSADEEVYVLRWTAHRPNLYRIPFGGRDEGGMRAMQGWVIERAPFRGNGFAPGESGEVIAEFKVDSARLPHAAQMWRMTRDGGEKLIALLDADGPKWRMVGVDSDDALSSAEEPSWPGLGNEDTVA